MNPIIITGCPGGDWTALAACLHQAELRSSDQALETWYTQIQHTLDTAQLPLIPPLTTVPQLPTAFVQNAPEGVFLADPCNVWVLDFWAEHWPQARFLLLHTPVDMALARALPQGVKPQDFVSNWEQFSRYLMQFQQRHRRRALLLDADAAQQHPDALFEQVQGIGLTLSVSSPLTPVDPKQHLEISVERWLANHFLVDYPHLAEVQLEVEAYFPALGTVTPALGLDAVTLIARYQQQRQQQAQANKETQEENGLLLAQLHQVQEELEQYYLQDQKHQSEIKRLTTECNQQRDQISELEKQQKQQAQANKETQEENELLLAQLHQVQEELEQYYLQYQALQQQPVSPASEPQAASQTTQTVTSTPKRSWRQLTKPWQSKSARRIARYKQIIANSGLFDQQWYLQHYPDVAAAGWDPIEHYLRHGVVDGRNPSPYFNTRYYVDSNPDLAGSTMPPLIHYINHGQAEGRRPTP